MKKFHILILLSTSFLFNSSMISKEEGEMRNLVNAIREKNIAKVGNSLGESVFVASEPVTLGKFEKKNQYSGFFDGKGYLYAIVFDTKQARKLTSIDDILSFKDFLESSDRINYKEYGIQIINDNDIYTIVVDRKNAKWFIKAFDMEFDIPEELLKLDME